MKIMNLLAIDRYEAWMQLGAARLRAEFWDFMIKLGFFWAITYTAFFLITAMAGWYRKVPHAGAVIIAGFFVTLTLPIVFFALWEYWYTWEPNFFAGL